MIDYKIKDIPYFHVKGRNVSDAGKTENGLFLFWAGSGLEMKLKTSELWAEIESEYTSYEVWLCVWINGRKISRFMAPKGKSKLCLTRSLNPEKENEIFIMRDTQPMSGDDSQILKINSISVSDGTEFLPVPESKLKLEFIGDSITTGEGLAGCPDEMDWISQWISVSENYAVRTVNALKADFNILSQSGWGVMTAWDNNVQGIMPPHYENVCSLQNGENQKAAGVKEKWDFSKFKPDFVFVNLGTNDSGAFFQPAWKDPATGTEYKMRVDEKNDPLKEDGEKLSHAVCNFLKLIRKNNPEARICWLWGMIDISSVSPYLKEGVELFIKETGDKLTDYMELPSMELEKTDADKGSRGHPGSLTHKLAAEKLIAYIENKKEE